MQSKPANPVEPRLARLASTQHGVVSLPQLRTLGLRDGAVKHRVRSGRLHRIHRGVYALGHARLSNEGRWMAAVLACGPNRCTDRPVALSHRSAAGLWQLLPASPAAVDVTLGGDGGRNKRAGIRVHRSATLTPQDVTLRQGIPVTTPARTLTDLRRCVSAQELGRAWRQAGVLGYRIDESGLGEREPTRSELERRFLSLCRRHRLSTPRVNVAIDGYVVDFLWPDARLVVETDGYRFHRGRAAFEHDHRRQTRLAASGYEVLRFTWRQLLEEPGQVVSALRVRLP